MVLARPSHFAMCLCLSLCSSLRECGATCEEQIVTCEITQNALCWSWLRLWISFCAYSAFTECKTEPNLLHTCWSNPCSKKLVELANSCWSKTASEALSFTAWYVLQTEQADDTWDASRVYNPFRLVWGEMWWQITLLRVVPTVTKFCDSFRHLIRKYNEVLVYGIAAYIFKHSILAFYLASILTSYLASFLASIVTFSLAFYLALFLDIFDILSGITILTFFLAPSLAFYLAFCILSDILFWHSGIFSDSLFCHSYLAFILPFYLAFILPFYLAFILPFYLAFFLAFKIYSRIHSGDLLAFYLTFLAFYLAPNYFDILSDIMGTAHWDLALTVEARQCPLRSAELTVEVWQCPLRSGARGWGPAVPAEIWSSRLKPGSAHWDLELAVEVRQCPLRSGAHDWGPAVPAEICRARGWGPAAPTEIWSTRFRSSSANWDMELVVEVRQCPLRSGAPAVEVRQCPHWDLELAFERRRTRKGGGRGGRKVGREGERDPVVNHAVTAFGILHNSVTAHSAFCSSCWELPARWCEQCVSEHYLKHKYCQHIPALTSFSVAKSQFWDMLVSFSSDAPEKRNGKQWYLGDV